MSVGFRLSRVRCRAVYTLDAPSPVRLHDARSRVRTLQKGQLFHNGRTEMRENCTKLESTGGQEGRLARPAARGPRQGRGEGHEVWKKL